MAARRSREEVEQRMIDHEVRLTRAREAGQMYVARLRARQERESNEAERQWYRRELISMLRSARTEADLHGLGLSDRVVREARLGGSLLEAWARFCPPPPPHE